MSIKRTGSACLFFRTASAFSSLNHLTLLPEELSNLVVHLFKNYSSSLSFYALAVHTLGHSCMRADEVVCMNFWSFDFMGVSAGQERKRLLSRFSCRDFH